MILSFFKQNFYHSVTLVAVRYQWVILKIYHKNFLIRFRTNSTIHRVIILNRGSMFDFQWREFFPPLSSAHRLLPHKKRDRGNAAITGKRRMHTSPSDPLTPQLGPLANERAVSSDVTCDITHYDREELHHFLPVLLRGMLPLCSIMTLCNHLSGSPYL